MNNLQDIIEQFKTVPINEPYGLKNLLFSLGMNQDNQHLLWKNLIKDLKERTEEGAVGEDGLPTVSSTILEDTILDYIQQNADLTDWIEEEDFNESELYKKIKEELDQTDWFWNESICQLAKKIDNLLKEDDGRVIIDLDEDEKKITIARMKQADAANDFIQTYVIPWHNVDGNSYDDVRKKDEVKQILQDGNKLQTTCLQGSDWTRLIMPQYGRRVQIEDLDRNFWVIGLILDGLSEALFGDNSVPSILQDLLDEIIQLWENILYLWLASAIIGQRYAKRGYQIITLPYPESYYQDNKRFRIRDDNDLVEVVQDWTGRNCYRVKKEDNFTDSTNLLYLQKQYSVNDLCVIPYFKLDNYKHNYYSGVYYPHLLIRELSEENNSWTTVKLSVDGRPVIYSLRYPIITAEYQNPLSSTIIEDHVAAAAFNNDLAYYASPFSDIGTTNIRSEQTMSMYAAVRPNVSIDIRRENGETVIKSFVLSFNDAAAQVDTATNMSRVVFSLEATNVPFVVKANSINELTLKSSGFNNYDNLRNDTSRVLTYPLSYHNDAKTFYLGEVMSWKKKIYAAEQTQEYLNQNVIKLKLGNFLPIKNNESINDFVGVEKDFQNEASYYLNILGDFSLSYSNPNEFKLDENGNQELFYYKANWKDFNFSNYSNGNCPFINSNNEPSFEKKLCNLVQEKQILLDGVAAVQYAAITLKESSLLKLQPCFFMTMIGLTPFTSSSLNKVYFNSNLICHLFHFLPLYPDGMEDENGQIPSLYRDYYWSTPAIKIGDQDMELKDRYGNTLGKIISYHLIDCYDSFYDSPAYGDSMLANFTGRGNVYTVESGTNRRRRSFLLAGDKNFQYFNKILMHDNVGQEYEIYECNFSTEFNGTLQYFDRIYGANHPIDGYNRPFNYRNSVSKAPIRIKVGSLPQQEGTGSIYKAGTNVQLQADNFNTGFPVPAGEKQSEHFFMSGGISVLEDSYKNVSQTRKNWGGWNTPDARYITGLLES